MQVSDTLARHPKAERIHDDLLTVGEAARRLAVPTHRVKDWARRGLIEVIHRRPDGTRLFAYGDIVDVDRELAQHGRLRPATRRRLAPLVDIPEQLSHPCAMAELCP